MTQKRGARSAGAALVRPIATLPPVPERIAAEIESLITQAELRPGDRLPAERELARQFNVSRPSIREAVKALEGRGLVRVRHGQGVFIENPPAHRALVAALGEEHLAVQELFDMREVLEAPAAAWAAERATAAGIRRLERVLADLDKVIAAEPVDAAELKRLDTAFHLEVAQMAGNRFLRQTLDVFQQILSEGMETTLLLPGRRVKAREEHRRLLAAIKDRDADAARNAARAHIRSARKAAGAAR